MPSAARLTTIATPDGELSSTSDCASHTPWAASYAITGSVARAYGPGGDWWTVRPGSAPLVQPAPPFVEVAKPVPEAPPSKKRPTCETATIVLPNANVSGLTAV